MHIENGKFFHIHKHNSPKWFEGARNTFGNEPNNAWRAFELARRVITDPKTNEMYTVDLVALKALNFYRKQSQKESRLKFYHHDPVLTLAETLDSLFLATSMVRELIYEDVRRLDYPMLPSRTSCIWLIPEDAKSVRFWLDSMRGDYKKVFRVNVTGELHRAIQQVVMGDTISMSEWRGRAAEHWNGIKTECYDDELTLSGDVEVLDEVPANEF
jgi:hypothetical protein